MRKSGLWKSPDEVREESLRPDAHLGYSHDQLGCYMLSLDVLDLAESEFRRAVWLNPFEAAFKGHLAWCLFREKKYTEAQKWILSALKQAPDDRETQGILKVVMEGREDVGSPTRTDKDGV